MTRFTLGVPRWGRRLLLAGGALVLAYALLGFLVAPALLKAKAPGRLSLLLGRPVTVERIRLNPFALSATVEGFAVRERDGSEFLGWDRLYVNLRLRALFAGRLAFNTIELERPYGRVTEERGGRLNFSDLVERLGRPAPRPQPEPGSPLDLRIGRLSIQGALITFLDRSLPEPFATTLGPLSLELDGFSTGRDRRNPYAFSGRTEKGETFAWNGEFSLEPLASTGTFTVGGLLLPKYHPFYQDQVAFRLADGTASAQAGYAFQWSEGVHVLRITGGSLDLQELRLAGGGLDLPKVEVRGLEADLVARTVRIGSVRLADGQVSATRNPGGDIDLVQLLTPRPAPGPQPPAPPLRLEVGELRLERFQAAFQDLVPARPVRVLARNLDLTLRGFSLDPAARAGLSLSLNLGDASLKAEGTVAPLRPAADLAVTLAGLDLRPFDPYLAPALDVRLDRGTLSLGGKLSASFGNGPSGSMAYRGNLRLERFEAADGARGEPFLGYRSLALAGLDVRTNPDSLSIRDVDLVGPEQRLVVAPDGSTNVGRALRLEPAPAPGAPLGAVGAALPPSQGPPLRLRIARTRVSGGRLSFVDRSLEPNAALVITGLEGTATSLSTEPDTQSALDFRGLAGGLAPLRIQGRAMPLRKDQDTDVTLTIQGSDLSDFSPYAGKFLGYTIHKGKLGVDARVRIQKRQLQALLAARLDQFYLGDRTSSPDATHLPVKLCLAILRDRKGVIDLELPVDGDLDAPDLHYGKIVWHALLNVLGKVATSPFSLLAKLGGGPGQDLSSVAFAPGSADPDPAAAAKVQALAKALAERPGLSLEAEGGADPLADTSALKRGDLDQLLLDLKAQAGGGPAAPLAPEERDRWLGVAFRKAFPPAPAAGAAVPPPPPPAEMEQRLLGTFAVTTDDLRQLADRRAKALLKLLEDSQVDPARLFLVNAGQAAPKGGGSQVTFGLKD